MADGLYYNDSRPPWMSAVNITSVTLATTAKAMYPVDNFPVLGGNYFSFIGKKLIIELWGKMTSAGTPGNLVIDVYYGNGGDANGTIISSSAAQAITASQTDLGWYLRYSVRCVTTGATGTLFGSGFFIANEAIIAPHMLIPASAPAASGSVNLTTANIISVQFRRSGSTGETAQIYDMNVIAAN